MHLPKQTQHYLRHSQNPTQHWPIVSTNQEQHFSQEAFTPLNCMTVSPIATPTLRSPPATTKSVLSGKSVYEVRWNDIATIGASRSTSSSHIAQAYAYSDPLQMKYIQNEKSRSCMISRPKNKLFSVSLSPEYLPSSSKSCFVYTNAPMLQRKEEVAANP